MPERLLPCPFCGCEAEIVQFDVEGMGVDTAYFVKCRFFGCDSRTGTYTRPLAAIFSWNRRASGWISAEERLPELGRVVLVHTKNSHTFTAERWAEGGDDWPEAPK